MAPVEDGDDVAQLRAVEAGILSLLHEHSRALRDLRRQPSSTSAILRAEWAATDLAQLALLRADLIVRLSRLD